MTTTTRELIKSSIEENKDLSPKEKAKCEELMIKIVEDEMLPKDAMGLDDAFLEVIYDTASNFFKAGKYEKAEGMYRVLSLLNPIEARYSMAIATCLHRLEKYEEAIQYYGLAGLKNENDPYPFYYASDCYLKNDEIPEACMMLKVMLKNAGDDPQYEIIKTRGEQTLKSLEDEMSGLYVKKNSDEDLDDEEDI